MVLTIGIIIAVFQQWCGTNVIFNYAQEIFQSAGYDVDNTFINIVVTGIANLIFTSWLSIPSTVWDAAP